jgi:hypothetical protein
MTRVICAPLFRFAGRVTPWRRPGQVHRRHARHPVEGTASAKVIVKGHSLDLLEQHADLQPDLIATDPPYAFGGSGKEHALSATVATALRESARRLRKGRWMLVMCAASYRSQSYMVEAVRGLVEPVRIGTWCKPKAKTKVDTEGWKWASVSVIAFRKGKSLDLEPSFILDHITAEPVMNGRRAELPIEVARWMVGPYAVPGGLHFDPFAGSAEDQPSRRGARDAVARLRARTTRAGGDNA